MVSSILLADPDVTLSERRQAPPVSYQSDPAALRPAVIALSAVGGVALGGVGGYWCGSRCSGCSFQGAAMAVVGALAGGFAAGGLAAVLTTHWGEPAITVIPRRGGGRRGCTCWCGS